MKSIPVAYLASYSLSVLGNSVAAIVLPLVVLQTTGSALGAGTVAAATVVPAVLAGLFMGVVIDRINRRTSSVVTDLVSAAAVAALPIVDMITGLSLGWFVLFGVIGALGDVPGTTAREALLPAIVRHGGVSPERITGLRESLGAIALLVGPAGAGVLVALFDGTTALWITSGTSLAAASVTLLIPHRVGAIVTADGTAATPVGNAWRQLRDGWAELIRNRFVLVVTLMGTTAVIVTGALQGIILPVYFTEAEQPGLLGVVLSTIAGGTLVGGAIYAAAGRRGRRRSWFVVGVVGNAVGLAVLATLASVWMLVAGAFILGVSVGLFSSLIGVLSIERIPEHKRGRVMGTQNAFITAASPLGVFLAGALTEFTSLNIAAIAVATTWLIALIIALCARSMRNLEPIAHEDARIEGSTVADHA
ncbi:MFS transporter [Nonomuraea roseola]|uniref:MFS transporter n=1 Tax=Nonomuraea roseola TaxID=46179 RepID=A0ABV5QD37_9ACTN